jgi:phage-related tail protein
MNRHLTRFVFSLVLSAGIGCVAMATEDPLPANPDPTLAGDQARAVGKAVKQNVKVAVDATKEGAQKVADTAKELAQGVAETTKEGAQEVAATAKKGTEKTKAALNGSKSTVTPVDKPADKPANP